MELLKNLLEIQRWTRDQCFHESLIITLEDRGVQVVCSVSQFHPRIGSEFRISHRVLASISLYRVHKSGFDCGKFHALQANRADVVNMANKSRIPWLE